MENTLDRIKKMTKFMLPCWLLNSVVMSVGQARVFVLNVVFSRAR